MQRGEMAFFIGDGDAARDGVVDAHLEPRLAKRCFARPWRDPKIAHLDVVGCLGRDNGELVCAVAKQSFRDRKIVHQPRVDGGQAAESSVVKQYGPGVFHLPLAEEQRVRRLVFPGLERQVQPAAMRRAALEFLPLGEARCAEVMRARVDYNRLGRCRLAKRGNAAKESQKTQPTHRRRRGCGLARR